METLFNKAFAEVTFDAAKALLYLELKGVVEGENYREAFNKGLEFAIAKNIRYLLINQATLQKSTMESKAWLITSWLPQVKKSIHQDIKVAVILSQNLFTKIGGEFVINATRKLSKFDIKTFSSKEEAEKWLFKELQG